MEAILIDVSNGLLIFQSSAQNMTSGSQGVIETIGNLGTNIPTVFQALSLGLLGILIPLSIAVLQEVQQKKGEEDTNSSVLDMHVILDSVFQIKFLIVFSTLMFAPFVFWEIQNGVIRIFEIAIATVGIISVAKITLNVYKWTKGNISASRLNYLKNVKKNPDTEIVWRSVWKNKKLVTSDEIQYFETFSPRIDEMLKRHERER